MSHASLHPAFVRRLLGPWPLLAVAAAVAAVAGCASPAPGVVRNCNALLSEDPDRAAALERSVAAFLAEASTGEFTEQTIDPEELERHSFFFRRMGGFGERPGLGAPSILKAYTLDGRDYFVTVALGGVVEDVPFLDMVVELKATPYRDGYRFHSPFEERTAHFHETILEDVRFRYSGDFDEERALEFLATRSRLARLSGLTPDPLEYFAFRSLDEMLKSYGLIFDEDRCNFLGHDLGTFDDHRRRYITGMGDENYMYGYASLFLQSADHDPSQRYNTMAVGFKTLFGGYWLIGTPMETLTAELREAVHRQPELDLLDLFKKGRNGQTQGHSLALVMAALLCQEALQESDFDAVLRLVYSGQEGERFFEELEAVLEIDEAGFAEAIVALLG